MSDTKDETRDAKENASHNGKNDDSDAEIPNQLPPESKTPNPVFDLERLRLSQDFSQTAGVKKVLLNVPVRKPYRQEFVRVHPDEEFRIETAVIELKEERENYLCDPELWSELPGEIIPKAIFTTINRQGVLTLWPVRLPNADGRHDAWNSSALEAADIATKEWIKVVSNMSLGAYEIYAATGNLPEPEWPDLDFGEILHLGFKDRHITSLDHPVIRRLQGDI